MPWRAVIESWGGCQTVLHHFFILTSHAWGGRFLHVLTSLWEGHHLFSHSEWCGELIPVVLICISLMAMMGFPDGSDSKESACNAGDLALIPGSGRSTGEGNGYLLQYSCLENSLDWGGRLQTMGSPTVQHTLACTHSFPDGRDASLLPCSCILLGEEYLSCPFPGWGLCLFILEFEHVCLF